MDRREEYIRRLRRLRQDLVYFKLELERERRPAMRLQLLRAIRDVETEILSTMRTEIEAVQRENANMAKALSVLMKRKELEWRRNGWPDLGINVVMTNLRGMDMATSKFLEDKMFNFDNDWKLLKQLKRKSESEIELWNPCDPMRSFSQLIILKVMTKINNFI